MNTQNSKSNPSDPSFNPSGIQAQLKQIGDQIESIAKQLKGQGQSKIDELYELGDKVEHFCDTLDFDSEQSDMGNQQPGFKNQDRESRP